MQTTGVPPVQVPAWQLSDCVHESPSLHEVPSGAAGLEQRPVEGSHVPATWQASVAVHETGFVPVQVPAWQLSVCVHGLPSLHVVPSGAVGLVQSPVEGSQVPATWQASLAVQVTGVEPVHVPA